MRAMVTKRERRHGHIIEVLLTSKTGKRIKVKEEKDGNITVDWSVEDDPSEEGQ